MKGKLNETNTFVLDDREETYSYNKRNGILIPEFESDMSVEDICNHPDGELLKLMTWLNTQEVKSSKDVRKLNKTNIFNKTPEECIEVHRTSVTSEKPKKKPATKKKSEPKEEKPKRDKKPEPKRKKNESPKKKTKK